MQKFAADRCTVKGFESEGFTAGDLRQKDWQLVFTAGN